MYSSKVTSLLLACINFRVARYTQSREESSVTRTQLDIVCEYSILKALGHVSVFVVRGYMTVEGSCT